MRRLRRRHVETACPLDCPGLLQPERVARRTAASSTSTAADDNPVTNGYICAKVRRFGDRVYGADRLLRPGIPRRPAGIR